VCAGFVFGTIPIMEPKRVAIFIDGGNFHHLVIKKLDTTELGFDFEQFVLFLIEHNTLVNAWKRYYTGTVREQVGNAHSKESMAKQTKFFTELKKYAWQLRTSKLKTRMEYITVDTRMQDYKKILAIGMSEIVYERKREKGIDVMLATDLIVGAVEDVYDMAIVVSSDADLIPAIDWVRTRGKQVQYIGFSIPDESNPRNTVRPLLSLMQHTNIQRVLVEGDLRQFIKQPQPQLFPNGE
jgi:uncharacterized LabA/DUF88 family protein